ncbi:MAG TPA: glycosyltransferase family 39 protein [Vicinamibacterales bacterium]|nr:glycosyltransferase family 39 protein [Vicinamibacterales bacterium]
MYTRALGHTPPYLIHDEAQGALQAHAIATTGHDLSGRLLPMYFTEPEFPPGRDPALIYVTALGLKALPFTEAGARTPTALVAVLDLVLMFFAARAVFQNTWLAILAAGLLALTPIHFIRGRLLLSPLYSIPFVLAWLWSLGRFEQQPTSRRFVAACLWLAMGMYSYLAAVVMMPLYLVMTLAMAARSLRWRRVLLAGASFAICLLPMAAWYMTHPERNAQIVSAYQLDAGRSLLSAIGTRLGLYWRFFDPAYLFVSGDASMINSTRTAGLFPMAFVILLPLGLIAIAREKRPLGWIIAAGFLSAPIVSVISGGIEMNRVMFAIPFAALIATYGVHGLWRNSSLVPKLVGALLVASIAGQFAGFYRHYMGDAYRVSAAQWFSGNVREAMRELIARSGEDDIYISREIEWGHRMWRFYAIEAGRADLIARPMYFTEPPSAAAAGSKLICPAATTQCAALAASGSWHEMVRVPSLDGTHVYAILERATGGKGD